MNRWNLGERSKDAYARVLGGGSAALAPNISLDAQASSTFGHDNGEEVAAHVGLRVGF